MDGLARTAGMLYREITIGGTVYRLATPRLEDLAEAEAQLLSILPDPIERAARASAHVPGDKQAEYWEAAFRAAQAMRKFDIREDWPRLSLLQQGGVSAFVTLRRFHGEEIASLADALAWLERAGDEHGLEQVIAAITAAKEETPPKKSPEVTAA